MEFLYPARDHLVDLRAEGRNKYRKITDEARLEILEHFTLAAQRAGSLAVRERNERARERLEVELTAGAEVRKQKDQKRARRWRNRPSSFTP